MYASVVPTLAMNARMGHPQSRVVSASKDLKGGAPASYTTPRLSSSSG
jgi:hypothetical protein